MNFITIDLKTTNNPKKLIEVINKNHQILLLKKKEIEQLQKNNDIHKTSYKEYSGTKIEKKKKNSNRKQEQNCSFIDSSFEEEVSYYLSMIHALRKKTDLSQISEYLPPKTLPNYQKLIFRIKAELLRNISEIQNLIEAEKGSIDISDLEEFKQEILLTQSKIARISEIETNQDSVKNYVCENHLFFVPTNTGNIKLLDEMEKVDSEYLEEFGGLFNKIKTGNLTNVKRFHNNIISGIYSIRGPKTRVLFDRINENDYVVITGFIQKSNRDKGESITLEGKLKNYSSKAESIKQSSSNRDFRKANLEYEQELFRILGAKQSTYVKELKSNEV